jgi:hypothetical protein
MRVVVRHSDHPCRACPRRTVLKARPTKHYKHLIHAEKDDDIAER